MEFYRFMYPEYESDMAHSRKNPVEWANQFTVPGVICPECGPWAGKRRLFLPLENATLKNLLKLPPYPLPLAEWKILANTIIESFATTSNYHIQPGDELGNPTVKITSNNVADFIFPWRGGILVTEKTRDTILESELTGCQFLRVEFVDKRSKKNPEQPLPSLYVLIVTGSIKSPSMVNRCPICDRLKTNYSIELSDANWDGNDFIIDENYPDLVFVTERVCAVFKQNEFSNYRFGPI